MSPSKAEEMSNFKSEIERLVSEKSMSYIEAIVTICEENDIDYERAAKILPNSIKPLIQLEAETLNLLKEKNKRLPI